MSKSKRSLLLLILLLLITIPSVGTLTTHAMQQSETKNDPQFKVYNITVGSRPYYAVYDPSNCYVYVLNENSSSVSVIYNTSVIATIPVGQWPWYAVYDPFNGYVYVLNFNSSTVSIISGTSLIATISVGGYPFYAVYDPLNGYVYVLSSYVAVISGTSIVAEIPVAGDYATYDPSNGYIYISVPSSNSIVVISGTSIIANITVGDPGMLIYDPSNGYVYVLSYIYNFVAVISGTSLIANISVGIFPYMLIYDPSNGYVYVINVNSSSVSVISGTSLIATINLGATPLYVLHPYYAFYDPSNGYIYVSSINTTGFSVLGGSIAVISGTSIIAEIRLKNTLFQAVYDPSNGYIYAVNGFCVVILSGTSLIANITVGGTPSYVVYDPSNGYVYVVDYGSNSVSVIEEINYYTVTFVESGLPPGTTWGVTFDGVTKSSSSNAISFEVPNGVYSYIVSLVPGYYSTPSSGNVTVDNSNVTVYITFNRILYTVAFVESGLPSGTTWSVTLNGTTKSSTSNEIVFQVPPGTYYFSVSPISGYNVSPSSDYITVSNSTTVYITFSKILPKYYYVIFIETGLPPGSTWSVTLNGITKSSNSSTIVFEVPSGIYSYSVSQIKGYYSTPSYGNVSINNSNVTVYIEFMPNLTSVNKNFTTNTTTHSLAINTSPKTTLPHSMSSTFNSLFASINLNNLFIVLFVILAILLGFRRTLSK